MNHPKSSVHQTVIERSVLRPCSLSRTDARSRTKRLISATNEQAYKLQALAQATEAANGEAASRGGRGGAGRGRGRGRGRATIAELDD